MIPQMNHVLKLGTLDPQESQRNYQNPDLPLAPQLVEGIVEWIKNVVNYPFMNTLFKALNDPTRREILELLKDKDLNAGEIAEQFNMSKPSISHHLDLLKQAELVVAIKKGNLSNTRSI
jgi:predicted transcriptional regulator